MDADVCEGGAFFVRFMVAARGVEVEARRDGPRPGYEADGWVCPDCSRTWFLAPTDAQIEKWRQEAASHA